MKSNKHIYISLFIMIIFCTFACSQENVSEKSTISSQGFTSPEPENFSKISTSSDRAYSKNSSIILNQTQEDSRKVIQTISMEITVLSIQHSIETIHDSAINNDGFIISSEIHDQQGKTYGSITLRIPRDKTTILSNKIREISEKISRENLNSNDVTDQYTDLNTRIINMKEAEKSYLRLFNEAKTIDDMVNIQEKINLIRWDIENLEGQINYMDSSTSTTLINVYLQQSSDQQAIIKDQWKPLDTLKDALRDLIEFSQRFANILIRMLIFTPIWIVLIAIALFLRKINWKRIKFLKFKR